MVALVAGCAEDEAPRPAPGVEPVNPEILGFEVADGWRSTGAAAAQLALSDEHFEGAHSLEVKGADSVELTSLALSSLGELGSTAKLRLRVSPAGARGAGPAPSLSIRALSAGIAWQNLGEGRADGQGDEFQTVSFAIPDSIRRALTRPYADLELRVSFTLPSGGSMFLDALALTDPSDIEEEPGPTTRTLHVELPEGVAIGDVVAGAGHLLVYEEKVRLHRQPKQDMPKSTSAGKGGIWALKRSFVGPLFSVGNVGLGRWAWVFGGLTTEGDVFGLHRAAVFGPVHEHTPLNFATAVSWDVTYPAQSADPLVVPKNGDSTLEPIQYGDVRLKAGATAHLRAGSYFFESLKVEHGSSLLLDQTAGAVAVYVRHDVDFRGRVRSTDGKDPAFVLGVTDGGKVDLGPGFDGVVVAPNSTVELSGACKYGDDEFVGSFFGKVVKARRGVSIRHRAVTLPPAVPLPPDETPLTPDEASVGQTYDPATYAERADAIVLAKVQTITSKEVTNEFEDQYITSVASLNVEQSFKGTLGAGQNLTLGFLGGTVGTARDTFWDKLAFGQDEEAILFLNQAADGKWVVLGGLSGKWVVVDGVMGADNRPVADFIAEFSAHL